MTKLVINELTIQIKNLILLEDFSFTARCGEIYVLKGRNGAGKTTLLKTLAGLIKPALGRILINNRDVFSYSCSERARLISLLLQQAPEQHYCSGRSRIAHGLMPTLGYDLYLDNALKQMIEDMAYRLKITHLLRRRLRTMSGGEMRLIHLARCLINPEQKILLLDEPSVYLDAIQQHLLIEELKKQAKHGRMIIFSSHDERFTERLACSQITIDKKRATVVKDIR